LIGSWVSVGNEGAGSLQHLTDEKVFSHQLWHQWQHCIISDE